MYFDQMGVRHDTLSQAILANLWDYDPSATFEEDRTGDYVDTGESPAEWLSRNLGRTIGSECYQPDHVCDDCSPF